MEGASYLRRAFVAQRVGKLNRPFCPLLNLQDLQRCQPRLRSMASAARAACFLGLPRPELELVVVDEFTDSASK